MNAGEIDSIMPDGATHFFEGSPLNPNPVFCRQETDGEWRWWSDTHAMWFIMKANGDFYTRLKELCVWGTVDSHTAPQPVIAGKGGE